MEGSQSKTVLRGPCHNPLTVGSPPIYIHCTAHFRVKTARPSLGHVCLSVAFQSVLDALVVGTVQQSSIGGWHTCAGTIADEQLQHARVAWRGWGWGWGVGVGVGKTDTQLCTKALSVLCC